MRMGLKLKIVRDGETILEIPLDLSDVSEDYLEKELDVLERSVEDSIRIHRILASETRTRMLSNIVRSLDRRFSEIMSEMRANQKVINENLRNMIEEGLLYKIEKNPREVHYTPSRKGVATLMSCIAMRKILEEIV